MTRLPARGARWPCGLCALALLAWVAPACAQFSGSLAAASDYRYRGVPLSDGRPSVQADANYDWENWYAGAFAASARLGEYPQDVVQWLPYAGFTKSLPSGAAVDIGAQYSGFSGGQGYGYFEAQAGVSFEQFSVRVFLSPNYFHSEAHTLYAQVEGSRRLIERARYVDQLRLVAHAGCLQLLSGGDGSAPNHQCDARAGLAAQWGRVVGQLSWVGVNQFAQVYPIRNYDGNSPLARNLWVAQLSVSF